MADLDQFPPLNTHQVTTWLEQWQGGDQAAFDKLFGALYADLRQLAKRAMRAESAGHTLQPTALVHEVYGRMVGAQVQWADRKHFLSVCAQAMRRVLIDHARSKRRDKRGGQAEHVSLDDLFTHPAQSGLDILDMDEAIRRLGEQDQRKEQIVELHYFGGLTHPEIAELLQISAATVDRDLRMARAWLGVQLGSA